MLLALAGLAGPVRIRAFISGMGRAPPSHVARPARASIMTWMSGARDKRILPEHFPFVTSRRWVPHIRPVAARWEQRCRDALSRKGIDTLRSWLHFGEGITGYCSDAGEICFGQAVYHSEVSCCWHGVRREMEALKQRCLQDRDSDGWQEIRRARAVDALFHVDSTCVLDLR